MSFLHPAQTGVGHQVFTSYPFTALIPPSFPSRPGPSILMDGRSEGSLAVDNYAHRWTGGEIRSRYRRQLITFDVLPDDVLLEIFDFYVDKDVGEDIKRIESWITLAHVCRCWRSIVFQSPRRLNLRLVCTSKTRMMMRDTLDIWPPFPLAIYHTYRNGSPGASCVNNFIATLERNDRVGQIHITRPELDYITNSAAMQKPFPELTHLRLSTGYGRKIPDSFLGGTAPRLRSLELDGVPFPGLPKLLLSATPLVHLNLLNIPRPGYIPPEAMATSLSALTNLESLHLEFLYPRSVVESRRPRPPLLIRSILPSLTEIRFKATSEYLEEILGRIDAPRLSKMHIYFSNQIKFHTPQLLQFISQNPTLRTPEKGHIAFTYNAIIVKFPSRTSDYDALGVRIECTVERQLSSIEQVCTSFLPPLSTLEDLYIFVDRGYPPDWQADVEKTLWLEILRPFAAVKNLYLCEQIVPRIAPALHELVGARTTEVLPTLETIFLEPSKRTHKGIENFVAARRSSSSYPLTYPVAVSHWDRDSL